MCDFQCFHQHVAHIKNNMYSDYVATNFAMTYKWIVSISMKDNHFNALFPHKSPLALASSSFTSQMRHIVCEYNAKYSVHKTPNTSSHTCSPMQCNPLVLPCSSCTSSKHASIFQLGNTTCLPLAHIFLIHLLHELSSGSSSVHHISNMHRNSTTYRNHIHPNFLPIIPSPKIMC
jgi:hypothetical protein